MKFSQKNIENWRFWKMTFFWVGHFEFYFFKKKIFFCFILMKISHKLCVRMDGTQFLWLWWYTAKIQSPQTFQPAVYNKLPELLLTNLSPFFYSLPNIFLHFCSNGKWIKIIHSCSFMIPALIFGCKPS